MSNLRELIEIRYEYPVEGVVSFLFVSNILVNLFFYFLFFQYSMIDNLRVIRNEFGVLIIPLVSSV